MWCFCNLNKRDCFDAIQQALSIGHNTNLCVDTNDRKLVAMWESSVKVIFVKEVD